MAASYECGAESATRSLRTSRNNPVCQEFVWIEGESPDMAADGRDFR
jgi:hypothetical protein